MAIAADDFDTICLKLGIGPEPFSTMASARGPETDRMVDGAIRELRWAAIRGESPLAMLIDAVALSGGLGPYEMAARARGQALRRDLIVAAYRLVRRFGLSEMNKRAVAAARKDFNQRYPRSGLPNTQEGFLRALGIEGGVMPEKVFYAWQSDLPNGVNRTFIENALRKAILEVNRAEEIQLDAAPDRDTRGERGSPNISEVILDKIRDCAVFVADLTIVGSYAVQEPTPNPNVVFETGFAAGWKGWERIVCVVNTAHGRMEDLPFDLRGRRLLGYELSEAAAPEARERVRKELEKDLARAIRDALAVGNQ